MVGRVLFEHPAVRELVGAFSEFEFFIQSNLFVQQDIPEIVLLLLQGMVPTSLLTWLPVADIDHWGVRALWENHFSSGVHLSPGQVFIEVRMTLGELQL